MAPDAIHPQALSLQWDLAWATLHLSTAKMPAHSAYSPVTPERPAADPLTRVSPTPQMLPTFPMLGNLQKYLWGALQKVLRLLWVAKELLSSKRVFLFLCSGYRAQAAMKGDSEKSIMGREGVKEKVEETRPDQTSASMLKTQLEEEREVLKSRTMELEVEEEEEKRETEAEDMEEFTDGEEEEEVQGEEEESDSDWIEWGSEEEVDDVEDEDTLLQQTVPTTGSCVGISLSLNFKQANEEEEEEEEGDEEEDSDWSEEDEEEEDDDSEASAESVELWESFLQSDDPYNPLSFSSCTTSRTFSNTHISPARQSAENTGTSPFEGESRVDDLEEEEEKEREDRRHSTHNIQQKKKVRFSDEPTVYPLADWALASRDARDGSCWLEMARDRDRFRRRVEDAGKVISLCLSPEHRRLVWEKLQK